MSPVCKPATSKVEIITSNLPGYLVRCSASTQNRLWSVWLLTNLHYWNAQWIIYLSLSFSLTQMQDVTGEIVSKPYGGYARENDLWAYCYFIRNKDQTMRPEYFITPIKCVVCLFSMHVCGANVVHSCTCRVCENSIALWDNQFMTCILGKLLLCKVPGK